MSRSGNLPVSRELATVNQTSLPRQLIVGQLFREASILICVGQPVPSTFGNPTSPIIDPVYCLSSAVLLGSYFERQERTWAVTKILYYSLRY
jgi:hypothetical protein